jgi:hypothetical protein
MEFDVSAVLVLVGGLTEERGKVDMRLVDTVDISESCGNTEVGRDLAQGLVNLPDILGLSVQGVIVNIFIVDTVFFSTGYADLHLKPLLPGGGAFEVLGRRLDVEFDILLGQIDHVRAEEGGSVLLEERLVGIHHAVEPGEKLLRAVVSVKNHRHTVDRGNAANEVCGRDSTGNGCLLAIIGDALSGEEGCSAIGNLENDGGFCIFGCLQSGKRRGRRCHVDGRQCESSLAGVLKKLEWCLLASPRVEAIACPL